ncbi:MAG TPA: hypothetical protein VGS19_20135 [Streptosporangiaceae bacterium]|nr:hypothetical protein [Streptosporangiaceae bacterium]
MRRRVATVGTIVCGLLIAAAPAASAGVTHTRAAPRTWIPYSPSFTVQQQGCGVVNGLVFKLTCTSTGGFDRAERRYVDYSRGAHKFQGTFVITSMVGSRISLKQTFQDFVGPYFLMAVETGGTLYAVEGGQTIASGVATVGTPVTVDTVHYIGNKLQVYINGSLKYTTSSPSGSFYDKFGAYRTDSGHGPITVKWSNLKFWHM